MPEFKPKLRETPKGLLSYDLGADAVLIFPIAERLQERFGLQAGRMPVFGLDSALVELLTPEPERVPIVVGWDIWSDLFIMSMDVRANDLIKEIAAFLNSISKELEELESQLLKEDRKGH